MPLFVLFQCFSGLHPSFLAWERERTEQNGRNNIQSLFSVEKIPEEYWIRKLLDPVKPTEVFPVFSEMNEALEETGHLSGFKSISENILIP